MAQNGRSSKGTAVIGRVRKVGRGQRPPRVVTPIHLLSPATLVGLVCSSSGAEVIPARGWALEPALELLELRAQRDSLLSRSIRSWVDQWAGRTFRFVGVDAVLRELAVSGKLLPVGVGWNAGYTLDEAWSNDHGTLLGFLSTEERRTLKQAGQRLTATLTTWSKNGSAPARSATI